MYKIHSSLELGIMASVKRNYAITIEQIQFDEQSKLQICAITTFFLCHNSEPYSRQRYDKIIGSLEFVFEDVDEGNEGSTLFFYTLKMTIQNC